MITIIPIEPLNNEHAFLIIEAFNKLFIDRGGQEDGFGDGWDNGGIYGGDGDGDGDGFGDEIPEEWQLIDENNQALTGGQNQETLRNKKS